MSMIPLTPVAESPLEYSKRNTDFGPIFLSKAVWDFLDPNPPSRRPSDSSSYGSEFEQLSSISSTSAEYTFAEKVPKTGTSDSDEYSSASIEKL